MTSDADDRAELRALARDTWGDRGADLLMAGLADTDLRKTEDRLLRRIDDVETRLGARIDGVHTELKADIGDLRGDVGDLRAEFARLEGQFGDLRGDFGDLRGEFARLEGQFGDLRGDFGDLRGDFGRLEGRVATEVAGIRTELAAQTRALWFAVVSTVVAIAGIAFSAFQLGAA